MLAIPLNDDSAQSVNVQLGGQSCTIIVKVKRTGTYLDLYVNNAMIVGGAQCLDRNKIVRAGYQGFVGELMFVDTQGKSDPTYPGMGSRFSLLYLDA